MRAGEEVTISSAERERTLELIGQIYDAALEPERWNDVIREVTEFVGGVRGQIFTALLAFKDGGFTFSHRMPARFHQEWQDKYINHDPWATGAIQKGLYWSGNAILGTDCISEEGFKQSIGYLEFAKDLGVHQLCFGVVFDRTIPNIPSVTCSIYRSFDEPRFGDIERSRMAVLVPHISRSLGVTFRLRDAQFKTAASLAALDHLSGGVLLIDAASRVSFVNRAARKIIEGESTLRLNARLTTTNAAMERRIDTAIAECLSADALHVPHFSRGVSLPRTSGGSLMLQFAPLPKKNDLQACAIVFITAPEDQPAIGPARLAALYGLSPAESELALQLYRGETLAEIAERNGIALSTVRSQLAAVFRKTNTTRQAELMKLLLALGSTIAAA